MVESMAEGNPHCIFGASQGMAGYLAWHHCYPQPSWWCKDFVKVVKDFDGLWKGIPSINATKPCHPLETYVAPDVDHEIVWVLRHGILSGASQLLASIATNMPLFSLYFFICVSLVIERKYKLFSSIFIKRKENPCTCATIERKEKPNAYANIYSWRDEVISETLSQENLSS